MARVDFNLSPTNNELHSFDLNIIPGISEDNDSEYGGLRNEGASVFAAEEPNPESEDLDVNVEEDHDTEDPFVGEEGIYALQLDVFSYCNCTSLRL